MTRNCAKCWREFTPPNYAVARGRGRYCSRLCSVAAVTTHGDTAGLCGQRTAEYRAWRHMKTRCFNEKSSDFLNYGGRGIGVCAAWRDSFQAFLIDMGRRPSPFHSIDRIDTNGDYGPNNCRWATASVQANNRRHTVRVTAQGLTLTISEWAGRLGIKSGTLKSRLYHMSPDVAVTLPLRRKAS